MATAEEILATMAEEDGTPSYLVIDNDLRTITIPENVKLLGVEHDKNVQRLHFKMPTKCGEFDLSEFLIRINYINAAGVGDVYPVKDMKVADGAMTFSWLVGPNAAAAKGNVSFIVCAKLLDADQVVIKEFHTQPSTLPVLEGLETCESVIQTYPDVLEGILLRLDNLEHTGGVSDEQVENAVTKYFTENPIDSVPQVTKEDEGKVLLVVDGVWTAADLPKYDGAYEVKPLADERTTLQTMGKYMTGDVVVQQIPYGETSNLSGGETAYIGTEVEIYGD